MQGTSLVDSQLLQFDNSGMDVWRTRQHAEDATSADVFFCLQLMGGLVLEQSGRTAILEAGDMALVDPALPYFGRFSTESVLLVLKTPRCALEARVGNSRNTVVRQLKASSGEPRLLATYFASLPSHIDRVSSEGARAVEDHLLDLIAISLCHDARPKISSAKSLALLKLRAAIDARLSDPELDPEMAAGAAGISVRYANALLSHEGLSVMRLILARRLERCRAALDDPQQKHRTLSEIAFAFPI